MPITHNFVSTGVDDADTTLVNPTAWNANHDGMNDHTHAGTGEGLQLSEAAISDDGFEYFVFFNRVFN